MGTTSPGISPGSRQLNQTAQATSDPNGNATFKFAAPEQGVVWTGTLSCANAPAVAGFVAAVALQQWCQWAGAATAGPVQLFSNQNLTVTATGLSPNASYQLSLIGSEDPVTSPPAGVWPDPTSSSAITLAGAQLLLNFGSGLLSGTPLLLTVPPQTRTLILQIQTPSLATTVTNVLVTGGGWTPYNQPPYLTATGVLTQNGYVCVIPLNITTTTLSITVTTSASTFAMQAYGDTQYYDEDIFYNGPTVAHSNSGPGTGVALVSGPCRLLTAYANCNTGGPSSTVLLGGVAVLVTQGGPASLTFPGAHGDGIIVPAGTSVTSTIVTGGQAGVTSAYP